MQKEVFEPTRDSTARVLERLESAILGTGREEKVLDFDSGVSICCF